MTAEILEFIPKEEHVPTDEDHCSFCGVDKKDAEKGSLVRGPEAMVCISCLKIMRAMLVEDDGGMVA